MHHDPVQDDLAQKGNVGSFERDDVDASAESPSQDYCELESIDSRTEDRQIDIRVRRG